MGLLSKKIKLKVFIDVNARARTHTHAHILYLAHFFIDVLNLEVNCIKVTVLPDTETTNV